MFVLRDYQLQRSGMGVQCFSVQSVSHEHFARMEVRINLRQRNNRLVSVRATCNNVVGESFAAKAASEGRSYLGQQVRDAYTRVSLIGIAVWVMNLDRHVGHCLEFSQLKPYWFVLRGEQTQFRFPRRCGRIRCGLLRPEVDTRDQVNGGDESSKASLQHLRRITRNAQLQNRCP